MTSTQPTIIHLHAPDAGISGKDHIEFLTRLKQPTWITIDGQDNSRSRAIVTLLHGNEPSGLKAVHTLLNQMLVARAIIPATRLGILIAAVDAALYPPVLSHRYLPGERDLNRCFGMPDAGNQSQLARNILTLLREFQPEAIIDTHNTSSHSVPFCVAVTRDAGVRSLASIFTPTLVVISQQLGTLIEHTTRASPIVTVEFGGMMDPNADALALETLRRFVEAGQLADLASDRLNCLIHPIRLETRQQLRVAYSSSLNDTASNAAGNAANNQVDLTMINTLDQLNFRKLDAGVTLGWFRQGERRNLAAQDKAGKDQYDAHFSHEGGTLTTRVPMTIFMATTDPMVANNDCLLYYTPTQ